MIKFIHKIDEAAGVAEKWIVFIFLTTMIFISFLQVVLRNIWHFSFIWAEELTRHLVLWIGFVGASLATLEERHINIDVLTRLMGPKFRSMMEAILDLFAAVICALMTRFAYGFVSIEKSFGEESISLHVPVWILQLILPIGFGAMTVRFFIRMIAKLEKLANGGEDA